MCEKLLPEYPDALSLFTEEYKRRFSGNAAGADEGETVAGYAPSPSDSAEGSVTTSANGSLPFICLDSLLFVSLNERLFAVVDWP